MFRVQGLINITMLTLVATYLAGCGGDDMMVPEMDDMVTDSALYSATFTATWSKETHSMDFPSNPHFSGLIGMTHNEMSFLFEPGQLATKGIKDMAERGTKGSLIDEIEGYQASMTARTLINGGGLNPSPGSVSVEFWIDALYPQVSITSMLAPSPDWFVAVSNLDLSPSGVWLADTTVLVGIYDAGTDSGPTYASPNQITEPPESIAMITDPPLGVDGTVNTIGTIRFERLE